MFIDIHAEHHKMCVYIENYTLQSANKDNCKIYIINTGFIGNAENFINDCSINFLQSLHDNTIPQNNIIFKSTITSYKEFKRWYDIIYQQYIVNVYERTYNSDLNINCINIKHNKLVFKISIVLLYYILGCNEKIDFTKTVDLSSHYLDDEHYNDIFQFS